MTNFEPCAAEVMRKFTEACGGTWQEIGGGVAGFLSDDSPINAVKGMDGKVGRAELQQAIDFFAGFGKDAVVELASWVESECAADLAALGFERIGEEHVMVRRSEPMVEEIDIITDGEAWSRVLSLAFFGDLNEIGLKLGRLVQHATPGKSVGIWQGGDLVAAAQLAYVGGSGLLAGDGTIEAWRGKGLQQRLIRGRVGMAFDEGFEWAHSEVQPGSGSERNYLRCGFVKAYSRVHYLKRFP